MRDPRMSLESRARVGRRDLSESQRILVEISIFCDRRSIFCDRKSRKIVRYTVSGSPWLAGGCLPPMLVLHCNTA